MSQTALIIGAKGRFGRAAAEAFAAAGWTVTVFARSWDNADGPHKKFAGDAMDPAALTDAARGADVIVNALNPKYHEWQDKLPKITAAVLAAAKENGATIMLPENVYRYGDQPGLWSETSPAAATTIKGRCRIEMQKTYEAAAQEGVRSIFLRGGDFIVGADTGNWFETYIANKVHQGRLTYPGALDRVHAWAFLPDMARAMVRLAEIRSELSPFEEVNFEGYSLTGQELADTLGSITGQTLKIGRIPWAILAILGLFSAETNAVREMRYLWDLPHRLDGAKLARLLPDFQPTPLKEALSFAIGTAPARQSTTFA